MVLKSGWEALEVQVLGHLLDEEDFASGTDTREELRPQNTIDHYNNKGSQQTFELKL